MSVTRQAQERLLAVDPIWARVREETLVAAEREPMLSGFLYATILNHRSLEAAVIHRVSQRLDHPDVPAVLISQAFDGLLGENSQWSETLRTDIQAVFDRDPACERYIEPLLYFKGFHAIQTHRLAHWLWNEGRRDFALYLQARSSAVFQTDIHPHSKMGRGIFLDHATGLVVGFTAEIGDNVSILQDVTLGGTGFSTTEPDAIFEHSPIRILPRIFAPAPIRTPLPIFGWRSLPSLPVPPRVTPCRIETLSPITAVSPTTRPVA